MANDVWQRCGGCGVNTSYPAALAGRKATCPQCAAVIDLTGGDVVSLAPVPSPAGSHTYATLSPTRYRRGIFSDGTVWDAVTKVDGYTETTAVQFPELTADAIRKTGERLRDQLVGEFLRMAEHDPNTFVTRPDYLGRVGGGWWVRVESMVSTIQMRVSHVGILPKYDSLNVVVHHYLHTTGTPGGLGCALFVGVVPLLWAFWRLWAEFTSHQSLDQPDTKAKVELWGPVWLPIAVIVAWLLSLVVALCFERGRPVIRDPVTGKVLKRGLAGDAQMNNTMAFMKRMQQAVANVLAAANVSKGSTT